MFSHVFGKNEIIIDLTNHKVIQLFTKNIVHQVLKNNMCISKATRFCGTQAHLPRIAYGLFWGFAISIANNSHKATKFSFDMSFKKLVK
jgi:hypothetical protein